MLIQNVTSLGPWLDAFGEIFATFDEHTQDSGHISYGIKAPDGRRFFVKTAGENKVSPGGKTFAERQDILRHAAEIQQEVQHSALIPLRQIVEAPDGVAVVYDWFEGELLRAPAERRSHPNEAHNRFKRLPRAVVAKALGEVVDLHAVLDERSWMIGDFYDGCLMYDFGAAEIRFMDFECYRRGAYINTVGHLPGSTRFMAPEELTKGAVIDSRTAVFNLGRMVEIFMLEHHASPELAELVQHATQAEPGMRPATVQEFQTLWQRAVSAAR